MSPDFSGVKAVIFDMDGVLFLSSRCHEKAYLETLASVGGFEDFSYERDAAGARTDETFRKIFSRNSRPLTEGELARIVTDKQTRVRRLLAKEGEIADFSDQLIAALRSRFRLVIATSGSRGTVDIFLGKASYAEVFEFILDGSSVHRAKPEPEIYLLAAKNLGLMPDECLVIEDAVNGVQSAVRAGMKVIAITGTNSAENLLGAGATYVVSNLKEVAALLSGKK